MDQRNASSLISYLKQNLLLLVSTVGALCLFAIPSKVMLLLETAIFLAVVFSTWLDRQASAQKQALRPSALVLAMVFAFIGALSCYATAATGRAGVQIKAAVLAAVGCMIAFYAFYCLACWFDEQICGMLHTAVSDPISSRLKANWLFPVSAAAFFFLEARMAADMAYLISALAAVGISFVIACRAPSLWSECIRGSRFWAVFCALTAVGICWFQQAALASEYIYIATLCAAAAFFFVFVCVCALHRKLRDMLKGIFSDVTPAERILYGAMVLAVLCFVTVTFLKTDAFYGTPYPYDIIYTSDSPILVQDNAYLWLTYRENDLRQPLFAVFAAPFLGISFLLGRLLSASPALDALLMNYPQILLLFFANFLLAKTLKLTGWKRMGFMLLICCSYPTLLFSLMMEQYIITYFYLILFLHAFCENRPEPVAYWGASGTLLTSVVLLPMMSGKHPVKDFKAWFRDMRNGGIGFVIAILAFARLDILLNVVNYLLDLNRFGGESLTILEKFYQYMAFIASCLYAPAAGVTANMWGNISWQLLPATGIHWAGCVILIFAALSAILNRDNKLSLAAAAWIGFSFVVLFGLGWGTQENGLVLYALYFGWAFWVLLYQLVEKGERVCKGVHLTAAVCMAAAAVLAIVNIPAIWRLVSFAVLHYPL